jgi:hypothetical protein
MADLLARLAERTLGVTEVARPLTPPVFAPATPLAVETSAASPPAIPPAHTPRPRREELPPLVPKTEHLPDMEGSPFAPGRKAPESKKTDEDADPTAKTQPLRNRVEQLFRPALRHDVREPDDSPLEEPAAEQPRGAATEPRSPIVPSPSRPPIIATSATERHARNVNLEGRDHEGARGDTATSIDASNRRQPAPPAIPASPHPSARPAARETNRVRSHEQPDATVQVNIGRVEVRAIFPPPPAPPPVRRAAKPALSLADYFKERDRGAR